MFRAVVVLTGWLVLIGSAQADVQTKKGDAAGAKATVQDALAFAETLPESRRPKKMLEEMRKKLTTS